MAAFTESEKETTLASCEEKIQHSVLGQLSISGKNFCVRGSRVTSNPVLLLDNSPNFDMLIQLFMVYQQMEDDIQYPEM